MENDNILDSGEIYKDPEEESLERLPELELEADKFDMVSWEPAKKGGASFKTHKMVFPDQNSIKFTGTFGAYLFGGLFFIVGICAFVAGIIAFHLVPLLVGFFFSLGGFYMIDFFSIPVFFNKRIGLYWKGRQTVFQRIFSNKEAFSVKLEDIKAVQLVREHITSDDSSYYSYEINLVLISNERLNVVDHGHLDSALNDAAHLAEFLGVPFLNDRTRFGL